MTPARALLGALKASALVVMTALFPVPVVLLVGLCLAHAVVDFALDVPREAMADWRRRRYLRAYRARRAALARRGQDGEARRSQIALGEGCTDAARLRVGSLL